MFFKEILISILFYKYFLMVNKILVKINIGNFIGSDKVKVFFYCF